MHSLQGYLAEISGMADVTLQPAAGAHGELTGMLMVRAYHEDRGEGHRKRVLIPDSAHGTNPATAKMVGYTVQSDSIGCSGKHRSKLAAGRRLDQIVRRA